MSSEKSEFREFVREHHPDRGGDPDAFVAGMARFAAPAGAPEPARPADSVDMAALPYPVRVGVALIRTWHQLRRQP
ncbi:hypothetical protein BJF78_22255 [Pseudonocardia sp. CNS-139]|nr:hypothetical protein BJF78_22255 [Pseudonocardia sp. CNS-139]